MAILLVSVWTFLAAPALCIEGVVTHACVCDSVQECSHETDCSYDPCNEIALRANSGPECDFPPVTLTTIEELTQPARFAHAAIPSRSARPDAQPNLTVPSSDLPLLI